MNQTHETVRIRPEMNVGKFEIDFLPEYGDDSLLEELRRIAALLAEGEPLTKTRFNQEKPRAAVSTIQRRFGSWKQALERAGLTDRYSGKIVSEKMRQQQGRSISEEDLLLELKRVRNIVGTEWLTVQAFNAHSKLEAGTVRKRFGSFRKALETAGITSHPLAARPLTDEDCFANLAGVWTRHGRPPQYREMFRTPSQIQGKTYVTRWGTWRKALLSFIDWADSDGDSFEKLTVEVTPTAILPKRPLRSEADAREVRPGLRFKVFRRDSFRCVACGRSPATHLNLELHAEHILAVANGGKTLIENLQTLCQDCNLGKGRS